MIDGIKTGRFEVRNTEGKIEYYIDGERVEYSELEPTAPEKIVLEVLQELYDRENEDSLLKWE